MAAQAIRFGGRKGHAVRAMPWRRQLWLYPLLTGAALVMAFPILWMVSTSLKAPQEVFSVKPTLIPGRIMWSNYVSGWIQSGFSRYFLNTVVIALGAVAGSVLFNSMAGYALAKELPQNNLNKLSFSSIIAV